MIHIVPAKPADAETLTEIAFSAKRHWGYSERWIEHWRDALTVRPETIASNETYVAVIEGRIVGFYALESKNDKLELMHMWVLPAEMRRGVGRSLLLHAGGRAKALGFSKLEIESDPNAEEFYLRLGARRVASRIRDVDGHRRELPVLIYEVD